MLPEHKPRPASKRDARNATASLKRYAAILHSARAPTDAALLSARAIAVPALTPVCRDEGAVIPFALAVAVRALHRSSAITFSASGHVFLLSQVALILARPSRLCNIADVCRYPPSTRAPMFVRPTDLTISCAAGLACRSLSGAAIAANDVRRTEWRTATGVTPPRSRRSRQLGCRAEAGPHQLQREVRPPPFRIVGSVPAVQCNL
jgi:hypothetical protein